MKEKVCWACGSSLKTDQKVCLECGSWQNWRRHVGISNTSLALLVALLSVASLGSRTLLDFYDEFYPDLEVNLSGYFDSERKIINLSAYNFGNKSANFGSNLRCTFGLDNAMGHSKENDGLEVEFWSTKESIVAPSAALQIEFKPQVLLFDPELEQVICFGALNYFDRSTQVEPFFLTIIPNADHLWWPIEGIPTTQQEIELLYPKPVSFQR
ncbi:MAG: hypothetical protein ABJJ53_02620 [Sulfitobacter sp.]